MEPEGASASAATETPAERAARLTLDERQRRVQGLPLVQAVGLALLVLGALLYLHAVWATANGVLAGGVEAERLIDIGGLSVLQGTLGLVLALVGASVAAAATWLPIRSRPALVPGTLEHAVVQETALAARRFWRKATWIGLGLLLAGCLVASLALRQTVADGVLYGWEIGGSRYRVHVWGLVLVGVGLVVLLAAGLRAVGRDDLMAVVQSHEVPAPAHGRVISTPSAASADPAEAERAGEPGREA